MVKKLSSSSRKSRKKPSPQAKLAPARAAPRPRKPPARAPRAAMPGSSVTAAGEVVVSDPRGVLQELLTAANAIVSGCDPSVVTDLDALATALEGTDQAAALARVRTHVDSYIRGAQFVFK